MSTVLPARLRSSAALAAVPALFAPRPDAAKRFLEFFAAQIRNPNTRKAYFQDVSRFAGWCEANGLTELVDLEPVHVAAYVEQLGKQLAPPSVKQHLAAIRMLCDWLVVGQVIATNPAAPVRCGHGPPWRRLCRRPFVSYVSSSFSPSPVGFVQSTYVVVRGGGPPGPVALTFRLDTLGHSTEPIVNRGERLPVRVLPGDQFVQ